MMFYFIKSSLLICSFYFIYRSFLKKEVWFHFNRFYLLFALAASLIIPFSPVAIPVAIEKQSFLSEGIQTLESIQILQDKPLKAGQENTHSFWFLAYLVFSILFISRFFYHLSKLFHTSLEKGKKIHGMQIWFDSKERSPHSFFNRLYLPNAYKEQVVESSILQHELAHHKQMHSLDTLIFELYTCFFWFNPITWLLKSEVKTNHEFLADQKAIETVAEENYLQTIIQHLKNRTNTKLSSSFSYLSIKKRIKMIQKTKNQSKSYGLKVGMALTLTLSSVALFSFKAKEIEQHINTQVANNLGFDLFKKPSGFPIKPQYIKKISSEFGMRVDPISKTEKLHTGVDLVSAEGTEILAVGNGIIVKAAFDEKYGNHIIIQHDLKYKTLYAHLRKMTVKSGDKIKQGEPIGIIGNTGLSLGTHLHFELMEYDIKIDPKITIGC